MTLLQNLPVLTQYMYIINLFNYNSVVSLNTEWMKKLNSKIQTANFNL